MNPTAEWVEMIPRSDVCVEERREVVTAVMGSVRMLTRCVVELWRALSRLSDRCWIYELKGVAVKDLSVSLHLSKHVRWLRFAR